METDQSIKVKSPHRVSVFMTPVNVAQSRPQDWVYVSEGGSTIVFSYTGPVHPDFTGKILRLRKTSLNVASTIDAEDDPVIAFQNTVIAALVPSQFLPDLEVVLLDATWLTALEALRDGERPAERRAKDQIDKARQKGILATDLIGGADILAIEIKPKWETAEIKTSTCRFCMHTRFKFKDGDVSTQYCPLDLFSKDDARVRRAIRDLWGGWVQSNGSLNNMRVFVSGKMIRPSEHSRLLYFRFFTPCWETISGLQRSLDALDIEGIGFSAVKGNPTLGELQDFVASYHSGYCALDHSKLSPEHIDTYLVAYLLSATFKDCSVIFRIRRSDTSGNPSVDPHAVSIIDLDLKGVDRFEQWADLDRRIVEYYRDIVQRKHCVE
ncbi:inositol-pentakisphosphate 2-kinase [Boletus edulis]|nr:inositol-pentakisphosphate 2-kinase [Boletus edulis]